MKSRPSQAVQCRSFNRNLIVPWNVLVLCTQTMTSRPSTAIETRIFTSRFMVLCKVVVPGHSSNDI